MNHAADRSYRALGRISVGFGLVALIIGVATGWASWAAARDAVRVWGVVVDLADREQSAGVRPREIRTGRAPVVEYETGGVTHLTRGRVYADPPSYTVGGRVAVLYPAGRPAEGRIDSFSEQWMEPLAWGGCGLLFLAVGGWVLRSHPWVRASSP